MDGLIGFVIGVLIGAGIMAAAAGLSMADENMKSYNDGYKKGLEDNKKMKGEK